jgi:hypothetical protein
MQVQNRVSEQADEAVRNAHQTMAQMEVVAQGAMEDPTTFRLRQGAQRPGDAPSQPENDPPGNSSDSNKGAGKGECKGQGCAIENTCPPEMTVEECIDYLDICTVEMTEEECLEYYDSLYESGQGNRPW